MAQPPMFYQRSPDYESNMRLAQQLMANPVQGRTPLAGLADAGQRLVGAWMARQEKEKDEARRKEYSAVLAQALQAAEPWQNPDTSPMPSMNAMERDATMGGGDGRRYLAPGEVAQGTGGQRAMIAALMGNEMTAPLGLQMQMQDLQNRQELDRQLALERAKPRAPVSVAPGAALVDPVTGRQVYQAPPAPQRPMAVSPGATVIDSATGRPIYTAPPAPRNDQPSSVDGLIAQAVRNNDQGEIDRLVAIKRQMEGASGRAPRESQVRIDALVARGLSETDAQDIVYGIKAVHTDPVTRQAYLVNKATGEAVTMIPRGARAPSGDATVAAGAPTLWGLSGRSTGPLSVGGEIVGTAAGMVGVDAFPEIQQARQFAANATNDLIRALSINPRFPVGEIERITSEVNLSPKFFDSPPALRNRMTAIDTYLRQRMENEQRAAVDGNLPVNTRQAAAQAANDIGNFLNILGVPRGSAGAGDIPPAPEGMDPEDWKYMTPEGRAEWQN